MISYKNTKEFTQEQLRELFLSVGWVSGHQPEKLRRAFLNSSRVVSAWDGERLVGLIRALDDGAWQAGIDCLLVHAEYQGRQIASALLETLKTGYADILYLNVSPDEKENVGFYEKHGFKVVESGTLLQITNEDWKSE